MKALRYANANQMIRWIIASLSGWAIGLALGFFVREMIDRTYFDQSYVGYAILGVCVGILQWLVALRGIINGVIWTIATGLAGILIAASLFFASGEQLIPPILQYYNPGCLSASCDSYALVDTWLLGVVELSLIVGISVAAPTSFALVLSRFGSRVFIWVSGSFLASLVGLLVYLPFGMGPGIIGTYAYLALIGPIVIAAVSAPFLSATLHKPIEHRQ